MFSILILGKPGAGKSHWVREIQRSLGGEVGCTDHVVEANLSGIAPEKASWEELFEQAEGGILLLKELELVKPHNNLLFEALSTANGKYGFEEKKYSFRVVFTTSYEVDALRKTEDYVSNRLFDRVAQLVVKFPSFEEADRSIWSDFMATWVKMKFLVLNQAPGEGLRGWLEANGNKLKGNFRDLDKIAILWHQFRLMGIEEKDILNHVLAQFETYSAFPEQITDLGEVFYFQKGNTKDQIMAEFRSAFKRWTKKTYGSLRKAAEPLKMSPRTMEKW